MGNGDADHGRWRGAAAVAREKAAVSDMGRMIPLIKMRAARSEWRVGDDGKALGWRFYPISVIFI